MEGDVDVHAEPIGVGHKTVDANGVDLHLARDGRRAVMRVLAQEQQRADGRADERDDAARGRSGDVVLLHLGVRVEAAHNLGDGGLLERRASLAGGLAHVARAKTRPVRRDHRAVSQEARRILPNGVGRHSNVTSDE